VSHFVVTAEANRDLAEIASYIASNNPEAAQRVRSRLSRAFERLAARPQLGHARPDLTDKPVRFWTVMSRFLVIYRIEPAGITILRVLSRGRDAAGLLR
jgi:plasmid stabilization system protein ParE